MAAQNEEPDLRALTDFLETDDRPSAIFTIGDHSFDDIAAASAVVFQNAAFDTLNITDEELQDVLTKLLHQNGDLHKSRKPRQLEIHGKRWSTRTVASGYVLLVFHGVSSATHGGTSHSNGLVSEANVGSIKPEGASLPAHDWTRHIVPDLPEWTEHVRTFDWSATGLGPMHSWSTALRKTMLMVMSNPSPRLLVWGPHKTFIYNDACSPLFGAKHPQCLGQPVRLVWADIWDHISPVIEAGFAGRVSQMSRMPLTMDRHGFLEETYWDFTIMPVTDGRGNIEGILDEIVETSAVAFNERRRRSVMKMLEHIPAAETLPELWATFCKGLEDAVEDISYVLLYSVADRRHLHNEDPHPTETHGLRFVLEESVGIDANSGSICKDFGIGSLKASAAFHSMAGPCLEAFTGRKTIVVTAKDGSLPSSLQVAVPNRAFGGQVETCFISPLMAAGDEPLGILIIGLTPRCRFCEEFHLYLDVIADMLTKAASLISLPEDQRREKKMAADTNVELSHQLRLITRQAERTEARFSRMSTAAPFGMFVFDIEGRPLHVNEAYLTMTGQTREQFETRTQQKAGWRARIHPDDLPRFETQWNRIREQKMPVTIEYRLSRPWTAMESQTGPEIQGETWLLVNAFPDVDTNGAIVSIQGWLTDISHRKFTEQLLARKLEDALENKRQTENFIDMTSHEMRNPLSAILQSADSIVSTLKAVERTGVDQSAVLSGDVAEEVTDAAQTIILCAQHQKRIVDDILTLSKLDASLLIISPDASHPPSLIYKALKMYEADMARSDIRTTLVLEPSYEKLQIDWVILDASRLLQVVINLLTNAIKFTQFSEKREIVVSVGASHEKPTGQHHGVEFIPPRHIRPNPALMEEWGPGEELYLQIAVSDTGRGMNEEEMQSLFRRFSQASPKTYGQYGGSGLGLFISRELCELQGGQIGVSSVDGKTTFTFFVRAKRSVPDGPPEEIQRAVNPTFLSYANSPIVFHRRGSVAVGDSIDLTREASKAQEVRVPKRSNSDESKPLARQAAAAVQQDASDLHVLIVEDNLINQKVMSQQLRRAGCTVHIANHGQECLDFLHRTSFLGTNNTPSATINGNAHVEQPQVEMDVDTIPLSVILLDLEMPTMDGLTCIREIRRLQAAGDIASHVPVIAVTANARSEQIAVALDAGMDSVVTKPFRIPELVPQMHALVADVAARMQESED